MSDTVTLPQDNVIEASRISPAPSPAADAAEHGNPHPPPASPDVLPADPHALLDLIRRGLAPDADDPARATARELCAQLAHAFASAGAVAPAAPVIPPAPIPEVPLATSPIAMAARALRQMPPDQLLDLLVQRLRAALPAGVTTPAPKGIQFQLVPVTPQPGSR